MKPNSLIVLIPVVLGVTIHPLTGEGVAGSREQIRYFNDCEISKVLTKGLKRLEKEGDTIPSGVLEEQLKRKRCVVRLPVPAREKLDPVELYRRCRESVVILGIRYLKPGKEKENVTRGAGFIITESGVAVTNYHLFRHPDIRSMGAMTYDGRFFAVKEVLAADRESDLCLFRLDGDGFTPLPLKAGEPVGSPITIISHPRPSFWSMTRGYISRYFTYCHGKEFRVNRMAVTADFGVGSSGAPVIDECGNAVGVVRATRSLYTPSGEDNEEDEKLQMVFKLCVPAEDVLKLIRDEIGKNER